MFRTFVRAELSSTSSVTTRLATYSKSYTPIRGSHMLAAPPMYRVTTHPMGFEASKFHKVADKFTTEAEIAHKKHGGAGVPSVFMAGSSVTGGSFKSKRGRPAGFEFGAHSDHDWGLVSKELYEETIRLDPKMKAPEGRKTRALKANFIDKVLKEKGLADAVMDSYRATGEKHKSSLMIFHPEKLKEGHPRVVLPISGSDSKREGS